MTVETRAYELVMKNAVEWKSLTNYWKSPCTFVKTPEGFDKA